MKIPRRFKVFGQTINVEQVPNLLHTEGNYGEANHRLGVIKIHCGGDNAEIPRSSIEQTFLHEVVHVILSQMNEGELCNNEQFVDVFAALLHQALTTAEYSE